MRLSPNAKIALTISPNGVDTVAFLSSDKKEALNFYKLIEAEIECLQMSIRQIFTETESDEKGSH